MISFLESAQKLEIEELIGNNQNCQDFDNEQAQGLKPEPDEFLEIVQSTQHQPSEKNRLAEVSDDTTFAMTRRHPRNAVFNVGLLTPEEINTKMKELYEKTEDGWRCLACDHTNSGSKSSNIRQHVETHLEGLCFTCNLCDKEFRSRNILNQHRIKAHDKN